MAPCVSHKVECRILSSAPVLKLAAGISMADVSRELATKGLLSARAIGWLRLDH